MKIYVPDMTNYKCFIVYSEGVIRAYEKVPQNNQEINYRDYYVNSNYIFRDGTQSFGSYYSVPTCLASDVVTDNVYYRNDFDRILIIVFIMSIFILYVPLKIFNKFFKKGGL